jgi:hypothetical protein
MLPDHETNSIRENLYMMHETPLIRKAMRLAAPGLLGLGLAFLACNDDKATGPSATTPTLMIMGPANGSTLSLASAATGVKVSVMKSNFTYGKIGDPNVDGTGHMHIYLDKPASSGTAYTGVIAGGDTATIPGPLSAGPHYIVVALQKNDHSPYKIQDSVAFTVGAASAPSVTILQPAEGASVSGSVVFKLSPKNFKIVAPGDVKAGEGHFHYFVDAGTYVPLADTVVTLDSLPVGEHTFRVTMQNSDHSDLHVEKALKFTVSAAAPSFKIAAPGNGDALSNPVTITMMGKNFIVK